jgi:hypothetical protein
LRKIHPNIDYLSCLHFAFVILISTTQKCYVDLKIFENNQYYQFQLNLQNPSVNSK